MVPLSSVHGNVLELIVEYFMANLQCLTCTWWLRNCLVSSYFLCAT